MNTPIEMEEYDNLIYISGELDTETTRNTVLRLVKAEQADSAPITVVIDSHGGSFDSMTAIYDAMNGIGNPITTLCLGRALSGAAILLAAGDKGRRYIGPNARVMIHEVQTGMLGGSLTDFNDTNKEVKRLQTQMIKILAKHTNMTQKELRELLVNGKDYYFGSKKAIEMGFADLMFGGGNSA